MTTNGRILNNPITTEDYKRAEAIYRTDLGVIKGKTTKKKPERVPIEVTQAIYEKQNIILAVDIMQVTGLNFLVTVSRSIKFITVMYLVNRKKKTIVEVMRQAIIIYNGRGHAVTACEFTETEDRPIHTILADNEFTAIQDEMEADGIQVNLTAKSEHVPEVERQNRVIKERARSIMQTLPYQHVPKKIRIALIQYVTFWLNNIPKVGQQFFSRDIICGEQKIDYNRICQLPFGAYVQVHDDLEITNTMQTRTTGAINLGTTGSIQGTHRFYNLHTGEIIVRRNWMELPIPNEVIQRLEELTYAEVESGGEHELYNFYDKDEDDEEKEDEQQQIVDEEENIQALEQEEIENEEEVDKEEVTENDPKVNSNNRYSLRPNRTCDYKFMFIFVKVGLTKWGDKARQAMLDELMMFLQLNVFTFMPNPTKEQMRKALRVHCFLTEKRDGRIKARAVADGRSQIRCKEEETYSPTVKLESIMLCSLIDALEKWHVVTIDIKEAFLKAHVPDDLELIVKMEGDWRNYYQSLTQNLK
jgi:hypothetical protein